MGGHGADGSTPVTRLDSLGHSPRSAVALLCGIRRHESRLEDCPRAAGPQRVAMGSKRRGRLVCREEVRGKDAMCRVEDGGKLGTPLGPRPSSRRRALVAIILERVEHNQVIFGPAVSPHIGPGVSPMTAGSS